MRTILKWGQCIVAMVFLSSCSAGSNHCRDDASMRTEQFVVVNDEIPSLVFDIRYYSSDNFLGIKVRGYESAKCILTRPASEGSQKGTAAN